MTTLKALEEANDKVQRAITLVCSDICKYRELYESKADEYEKSLKYKDWDDALYKEHCTNCPLYKL